jgi:hypothetical protein
MARQLSPLKQGSWHCRHCKLCGGIIDKERVERYRAVRTLPYQECLKQETPLFEDGCIRVGSISSTFIKKLGSLPGLYLVHRGCIRIIRHAAGLYKPTASLLTLISILRPTAPVSTSDFEPLSDLDGDILATIFSPNPITQPHNHVALSPLQGMLHTTPPEILSLIRSNCLAEYALAITIGLPESHFLEAIRDDTARQRMVVGIQATRFLKGQAHHEV